MKLNSHLFIQRFTVPIGKGHIELPVASGYEAVVSLRCNPLEETLYGGDTVKYKSSKLNSVHFIKTDNLESARWGVADIVSTDSDGKRYKLGVNGMLQLRVQNSRKLIKAMTWPEENSRAVTVQEFVSKNFRAACQQIFKSRLTINSSYAIIGKEVVTEIQNDLEIALDEYGLLLRSFNITKADRAR